MKAEDYSKKFTALSAGFIVTLIALIITNGAWIMYDKSKAENVKYLGLSPEGIYSVKNMNKAEAEKLKVEHFSADFMGHMFAHKLKTFKGNVEYGLNLCDKATGNKIYNDFKKGEVLKNYQRYGAETSVTIDKIEVNTNSLPYEVKVYATQVAHISGQEDKYPLACKYEVVEVPASEDNKLGYLIQNFDYIEYQNFE